MNTRYESSGTRMFHLKNYVKNKQVDKLALR